MAYKNEQRAREYRQKYYRQVVVPRIKRDPDSQRKSHLKIAYGITLEDYNRMFNKQGGCCAICGKHQSELRKKLHVDHNHKTGKVRGLLCQNCNSVIGQSYENREILNNAILYLESG
jgi:hypothetical protein